MSQLDLFSASKPAKREDTAVFSPCRTWRFSLHRVLGGDDRVCAFIGANPSVANEIKNDHTIAKDVGFATRWGCGRLIKVNCAAYVATDPDDMYAAAERGIDVTGGAENDAAIRAAVVAVRDTSGLLVLTSGNIIALGRLDQVLAIVRAERVTPWCLGINGNGTPKHNARIGYETPLVEYRR